MRAGADWVARTAPDTAHTDIVAQLVGTCGAGQESSFIGPPLTSVLPAVPLATEGSEAASPTARPLPVLTAASPCDAS